MSMIISCSYLYAGVELKNLSPRQYKRLVTPHLQEIVQAYRKVFIKIDKNLKQTVKYTPYSQNLFNSLKSLRSKCKKEKKPLLACKRVMNEFRKEIIPFYNFWKAQITADTTSSATKIARDLKEFVTMSSSPPIGEESIYIPENSKLLSLYIQPYPFLLSKISERSKDMNKLWGNAISIIVNHLQFAKDLDLLKKHIDRINLQINETRMIWTRRQKVRWNLQKSINYIHSQWNFMLKSTLKF